MQQEAVSITGAVTMWTHREARVVFVCHPSPGRTHGFLMCTGLSPQLAVYYSFVLTLAKLALGVFPRAQ